jgi:hypothetical protein
MGPHVADEVFQLGACCPNRYRRPVHLGVLPDGDALCKHNDNAVLVVGGLPAHLSAAGYNKAPIRRVPQTRGRGQFWGAFGTCVAVGTAPTSTQS